MRWIVTVAALAVAGCGSVREARINAMDANDDAACRSQHSMPYAQCRQLRLQYRAQAEQERAASTVQLQRAFEGFKPVPPVTNPLTTCVTTGSITSCN
jgi:hypothetical protein